MAEPPAAGSNHCQTLSTPPSVPPTIEARVAAYSTNVLPEDYTFDPSLSVDDNYMVLTLIYARLSMSKRGNMACIVVDLRDGRGEGSDDQGRPPAKRARVEEGGDGDFPNYPGRILAHSNNFPQPTPIPSTSTSISSPSDGVEGPKKPLKPGKQPRQPKPGQSAFLAQAGHAPELHAEARSICLAASRGIPLAGSTAYVSFPPCQHCLPLLVAAGVKRLVYRQRMTTLASVELCRLEGIECVEYTDKNKDERLKERVARWWKERGEGRDETRTRLEKWWKEAEERVEGKAATGSRAKERVEEANGIEADGHAPTVMAVKPEAAQ